MKLTVAQITLLESALKAHTPTLDQRAEHAIGNAEPHAFWLNEAAEARHLQDLLKEAYCVEVECVNSAPATEACGDIHCHGLHPVKITPAKAAAHPPPGSSGESMSAGSSPSQPSSLSSNSSAASTPACS